MNSLPTDIREKLELAIGEVLTTTDRPQDMLTAIADIIKPPPKGPIDTRSAAAFNSSMMQTGIAAMHANLIGIGDELGYFRALLDKPMTSEALAAATKTDARYTKEWCITMAAGTALEYNYGLYHVPEAIRECVAVEQNPDGLIWGTILPVGLGMRDELVNAYRSGGGIDWRDRDFRLAKSTCNFFKPFYEGMLVESLPESVIKILEKGGTMADIGCGSGLSTCIFARAFPEATFHGIDYSDISIQAAKEMAKEWGLENVSFACEDAKDFVAEHQAYDVTCFLDCFHDMAVAKASAKRAFEVTKTGGYCFLIEPMGPENDSVEEQLAIPSIVMDGAFSCHICLCCAKMNGGDALGTFCPTSTHRKIFVDAGYSSLESICSPINDEGYRLLLATKQ